MSIIPPSKKSGFTLIEIVIVLAIGALIMVVVFVAAQGALMARRNDQRRNDARLVLAALESNTDLYDAELSKNPRNLTAIPPLTRRLLGVTKFEDPSQVSNSGNTEVIPATDTNKSYGIAYRDAVARGAATTITGVSPKIEISRNAKCEKINGSWTFVISEGSNAVYIALEPFKSVKWQSADPSANPPVTEKWQIYGTGYCINT